MQMILELSGLPAEDCIFLYSTVIDAVGACLDAKFLTISTQNVVVYSPRAKDFIFNTKWLPTDLCIKLQVYWRFNHF